MPAFDYSALAAKAQELVTRFGRAVTLRRLNVTPPDPAKPWRGPADARAGAFTLTVSAVFVEPSSLQQLGLNADLVDWVAKSQNVAIVAAPQDLRDFSELLDTDSSVWRITGVSTLQPAADRLLHFVGVAR
jgi:hypothetical protein